MLIYFPLVLGIFFFHVWLWRQPEMQPLLDRICSFITNTFLKQYLDDNIRLCIKDFVSMMEGIKDSKSLVEVESWLWEVDVYRDHWINKVPDTLLNDHSDRLEAACHAQRDRIMKPVMVFDNTEISLS